jgi:hypothetical protein
MVGYTLVRRVHLQVMQASLLWIFWCEAEASEIAKVSFLILGISSAMGFNPVLADRDRNVGKMVDYLRVIEMIDEERDRPVVTDPMRADSRGDIKKPCVGGEQVRREVGK